LEMWKHTFMRWLQLRLDFDSIVIRPRYDQSTIYDKNRESYCLRQSSNRLVRR